MLDLIYELKISQKKLIYYACTQTRTLTALLHAEGNKKIYKLARDHIIGFSIEIRT